MDRGCNTRAHATSAAWRYFKRALPSGATELARLLGRHAFLAVFVCAAAVAMAITASDAVTPRYRAQASLDLRKTKPGPDIASVLDARLAAIRLRVAAPPSSVTLFAKPADPTVVVVAEARTARNAEQAADIYAAELLARDVGVDRTATAAAIVRAKAALSRLHGPVRSIRRRLRALEKRQITDADILVAAPADRVAGPEPVTAAIVAALIALVVAAGAAAALEARRPPCAVA